MARGIDKYGIKKIIDELRKKPLSWADLKALSNLSDSTLNRYLNYLEFWKLASKNDAGLWDWHERVPTYETEHDYEIALTHSKKLMKTLEGFFGVSMIHSEWFQKQAVQTSKVPDELFLSAMLREHLRTGYPSVFEELTNFDKLVETRDKIATELSTLSSKIEGDKVVEYVASYRRLKAYAIPRKFRKEVKRVVASIEPARLSFIEETIENHNKKLIKISNDLRKLMFNVDHGEPLLGVCDLCPKSKVSN